jgi:tetratricopeptide (TPR) repeat protein
VAPPAHSLNVKKLLILALGTITLALYLPTLRHDFLAYDDQQYVTENRHVQGGLTAKELGWAFGFHASNWHPLTWVSHMFDCQFYGLNPLGHHLTNVLLHSANTVVLFLVLSGMTGALWRSALVAALFGWHPLHVESVAWVAERKDVLSAFFFLLTLGAYGKYVASGECRGGEKSEIRNPKSEANPKKTNSNHFRSHITRPASLYVLTLFFFAFGLMSKPMVVTLPFVLLLLDYWPLQQIQLPITNYQLLFRLFLEKVPFFAVAAVTCLLTIKAQSESHAIVSTAGLTVSTRVGHALASYVHYIGAMFWPRHLAVYYPYESAISSIQIIGAALFLALVTIIAIRFARKLPYLVVGWLWFLGMLVAVIGLVQVGEQAWADRYTYLPSIGLFIAVVWSMANVFERHPSVDTATSGAVGTPRPTTGAKVGRGVATAPCVLAIGIGIAMLVATSVQLRYWRNTRALFEHTAAATQKNYMAVTVLGSLLAKEGKLEEAIDKYKTALSWKPDYPEAHFFLGNALDQQGKLDEAIAEYQKALGYQPILEQTHIFLGAALAKQQKLQEARSHYLSALKVNPESSVAHNNLAKALQTEGRLDEAMEHYSAALKFDPGLAQAHNNLGVLLLARSKTTQGIRELREALRLKPEDLETQYNLALALNQQQQWNESAELLGKVLEKRGNDANAHCQFAIALTHLQRTREAMSHFASALLIQPDFPDALDGLSWILATAQNPAFRNGTEAVRMAERACALTNRKEAQKLKTLAAAYAEAGRYEDAVSSMQTALEAGSRMTASTTNEMQSMLTTFKAGKPWRDPEIK